MRIHLAPAVAFAMLSGLSPAQAGGDLPKSPVVREETCPPWNQWPVPVTKKPGWVCIKVQVSKEYWKRCKTKTWYASSGTGLCTRRFFTPDGEFCAPPEYKGKLTLEKWGRVHAVIDFSKAQQTSQATKK